MLMIATTTFLTEVFPLNKLDIVSVNCAIIAVESVVSRKRGRGGFGSKEDVWRDRVG